MIAVWTGGLAGSVALMMVCGGLIGVMIDRMRD